MTNVVGLYCGELVSEDKLNCQQVEHSRMMWISEPMPRLIWAVKADCTCIRVSVIVFNRKHVGGN